MKNKYAIIVQRFGLMLGLPVFLLVACSQHKSRAGRTDDLNVTVQKPQLNRDFKEIKKSGTLRMITRYSSNSYFLHQGLEYGFEYELLKKFAHNHGLSLDVIVVQQHQNPYDMLNRGQGDVIANNYTITPVRKRYVSFTQPYNLVNQIMVFSGGLYNPPHTLQQVIERHIPVTIRKNSSYYHQLVTLKKQGHAVKINLVPNNKDTESLLFDVSQGDYMATVADDNIFQASNNYMDNLVRGPVLARGDSIAWAVRKNSPHLKQQMNDFLSRNFRFGEPGEPPKRSAFLNILRRRYFRRGPQIAGYYNAESAPGLTGVISPYDDLFKKEAASAHIDWLMVAAIAAQETQFNPGAKSWTGAMGLMQVLPRYSEVDSASMLYDPLTNIREGVRIISTQFRQYSYMDSTEQWHFALAAYNAGQGHVADARRLAIDLNKDPNKWAPTADALLKLMDRNYYKNARHGFCRGIETVNYVRDVMSRYQTYKTVLAMASSPDKKNGVGVLGFFN